MSELVINVARREHTGKNESRRMRREGLIPAVLYGEGKEAVPLSVESRTVDRILHSEKGENTLFDLILAGTEQRRTAMIKAYQLDPLTSRLVHADFVRISADRELHVDVHVELVGLAVGVKTEGGLLDFTTRVLEVACLPKDIPAALRVDVTELHVGQVLRASDVPMPPGVRLVSDKAQAVASVHVPKAEAEPTPTAAEAAEAAAAAVPGAEGAAAAPATGAAGEGKPAEEGKKKGN